jgi:hypothetical protein
MILSGTLLLPNGQPFKDSYVKLIAKSTSEQVLKSVTAGFRTDEDGEYSVDCPLGNYSVVVSGSDGLQTIGSIVIDENTTETNINALILLGDVAASNPLVQQVREDALAAVESAEAAALSAAQAAQGSPYNLVTWSYTQAFQLVSATRDSNGAIISANIVWPDGAAGVFTTDSASVLFPGAIDAWHATYLATVTKTVTQPAVTRDVDGAVIVQPAITIV